MPPSAVALASSDSYLTASFLSEPLGERLYRSQTRTVRKRPRRKPQKAKQRDAWGPAPSRVPARFDSTTSRQLMNSSTGSLHCRPIDSIHCINDRLPFG